MSIVISDLVHVSQIKCNPGTQMSCAWSKATIEDKYNYELQLQDNLNSSINLSQSVFNCKDWHCKCEQHKQDIEFLCNSIIDCCINAGLKTIPVTKFFSGAKEVPGWSEQV